MKRNLAQHMSKLKYILATFVMALLACESPTDNNIEQARLCTNNAAKMALSTPAAAVAPATACESFIISSNLSNNIEGAKIQFSDILMEDQILGGIAQAAGAKSGSVDSLNSMMPLLIANPAADGQRMLTVATTSGDPSLVFVAGLINMATTLSSLSSLTSGSNPAAALTALQNCNTAACQNALASSFNSMAQGACASPSNQASTDPNNLCYKSKQITMGLPANPTAAQLQAAIAAYAASPH